MLKNQRNKRNQRKGQINKMHVSNCVADSASNYTIIVSPKDTRLSYAMLQLPQRRLSPNSVPSRDHDRFGPPGNLSAMKQDSNGSRHWNTSIVPEKKELSARKNTKRF